MIKTHLDQTGAIEEPVSCTINFWFFQQLLIMFRNDLNIQELKKRASTFGAENAGSKRSSAIQTALK